MSQKSSSDKNNQNKSSDNRSGKRGAKTSGKNDGLQKASAKRFVTTVKVFVTEEERDSILESAYKYGGISNYIRHHLGLPLNAPGRKRKNPPAAIELDFLDD